LQEALGSYEGTLLIVSHDRAFLDPLVRKVFEFSRSGLAVHLGTVSDYLARKHRLVSSTTAWMKMPGPTATKGRPGRREQRRHDAESRQARSRVLTPIRERLETLELEIKEMEARRKELEAQMSSPEFYKVEDQARTAAREYRELGQTLEQLYEKWAGLEEELTKLAGEDEAETPR